MAALHVLFVCSARDSCFAKRAFFRVRLRLLLLVLGGSAAQARDDFCFDGSLSLAFQSDGLVTDRVVARG